MTEDTRKDKRAKIVSLNVRYKSATVDEFIENHSHDVSKGGLFIKTPTPFPPGTLIKFEIRIAGDKPVIMGVGRVVWKRDPNQAAGDRPSGMGVKFIKIDEPSRQVIERVVAEREGAGAAYSSEGETDSASLTAARSTSDLPLNAKLTPVPGAPSRVPLEKKSTIMGIGAVSSPPPANDAALVGGTSMFPTTNSEGDMPPPKERTVMKQAAELLEEALKEAGGSMEEIGTNPLFADGNKHEPRVGGGEGEKKASPASPVPAATPSAPAKAASNPPHAAAKPVAGGPSSGSRAAAPAIKTSSAKVPLEDTNPRSKRASEPAPRRVSAAQELAETPPPRKGSNAFLWALLIVLLAGGGVAYQMGFFGPAAPPAAPAPTAAEPTPSAPAATASAAPTAAPSASSAPAAASASPSTSASAASATPSASAASSAKTTTTPAPTKPAATATSPAPTSTPPVAATATTPPAATTATPASTPTPTAAPTPRPKPTATDTSAATATATTPPAPRPKPKPKSDDDNPY